jgi:hypothetical protein
VSLPEPPEQPREVVLVDLPGDQLEAVEENGGASLANWRLARSIHRQVAAVVAAVYEADFEEVRKLSLTTLAKYVTVSIAGDDDPKPTRARSARS